jgi:uncharacterized protein
MSCPTRACKRPPVAAHDAWR